MKKRQFTHMLVLMAVYLLGVHEGKIALWQGGDPEPVQVFPYSISALPDAEQERLRKGIPIESIDSLHKLLEAYLS